MLHKILVRMVQSGAFADDILDGSSRFEIIGEFLHEKQYRRVE